MGGRERCTLRVNWPCGLELAVNAPQQCRHRRLSARAYLSLSWRQCIHSSAPACLSLSTQTACADRGPLHVCRQLCRHIAWQLCRHRAAARMRRQRALGERERGERQRERQRAAARPSQSLQRRLLHIQRRSATVAAYSATDAIGNDSCNTE